MNIFIAGASSGIGAAVAKRLLDAHHQVAVMARRAERLQALTQAIPCPGDITQSDDITAALETAMTAFHKNTGSDTIDRLFNFAGGAVFVDPSAGISPELQEQIKALVDLNVMGSVRLLKAAEPYLARDAKIGICSSFITQTNAPAMPGTEIYFWTKKIMEQAMVAQRPRLAERGISLTLIRPGVVSTEAWQPAGHNTWKGVPDVVKLFGRLGFDPDDCAKALIADVEDRKPLSFPTLDARLANRHPELHRAMLHVGRSLMENSQTRPRQLDRASAK